MSCVAELMSPVEHTVVWHQSLGEAAGLLRGSGAAVLVLGSRGMPLGVLTEEVLAAAAGEHPDAWAQSRCAEACLSGLDFLRAEQSVEGVLWRYRTETVRPLAVLNGRKPVGILYPDRVFLWCLEQPHLDSTRLIPAPPADSLPQLSDGSHFPVTGPGPRHGVISLGSSTRIEAEAPAPLARRIRDGHPVGHDALPANPILEVTMPTRIGDLLRPLGCSVCETQSVETAHQALTRAQSDLIIIRDLCDRPVGVLTREDIDTLRAAHPGEWSRRRCAATVTHMPAVLGTEDPVEACVSYYQDHGVRPVVIFSDQEPVGVLHPTEVFQWCAQRDGALVEELAERARSTPRSQPRREPTPAGSSS